MSILVYVDHVGGTAKQISWEIMGKARNFADQLGQPLVAVVVGDQTGNLASEASCYGADRVLVAEDPEFAPFRAGVYAAALKSAIEQAKAEIVLLSNSFSMRDMSALVACQLGIGLAADCQDLQLDASGNLL